MSRWTEAFQNHAFRTSWNSLSVLINDEGLEHKDSEAAVKEVARARKVMKYIDSVMEQVDPELMPLALLETLNQHATNGISEANNFKANQNIGHMQNVNSYLDSALVLFSQTPFILSAQQKGAVSKAASAYSETIDQHLSRLKTIVDEEIGGIEDSVTQIQETLTGHEKSLLGINEQINTITQNIQVQTAQFNTQFQTGEKNRGDKFDAALSKLEKRIDDEVLRLGTKADSEFERLATKSVTIIEVLVKLQDDASKVFNVVVNTLQAGAYSSYANEEKKSANNLRWAAIGMMIVAVAIMVVPEFMNILAHFEGYSMDWQKILGRVPLSAILFIPAFYFARESNKHRNTEVQNRRREHILSTIDPYLALLPKDTAEKIKVDVAKGIFSENSPVCTDSSSDETANLIAQITNLIKQFRS